MVSTQLQYLEDNSKKIRLSRTFLATQSLKPAWDKEVKSLGSVGRKERQNIKRTWEKKPHFRVWLKFLTRSSNSSTINICCKVVYQEIIILFYGAISNKIAGNHF